jgi:uncharacterized membrane protein YdjX (TVP38/TMEM64 family)
MLDGTSTVREVEALYLAAIDRAEHCIYIENQFVTADAVAERLCRRLRENPALEVLIVSTQKHHSWLEARSMKAGRMRFMQRLEDAGVADQVRLVYPTVAADGDEQSVLVHAKLMIVDDRLLRIGSANLNNRSMGTDTECDLAIEADNEDQARAVAAIRNRLLGEHLGAAEVAVADALAEHGSLIAAMDALGGGPRALRPIEDHGDYADPASQAVGDLADPERPIEASKYVSDRFGGQPAGRVLGRIGALMLIGLVLVGLALAWQVTPLSEWTDPEQVRPAFAELAASPWAPVVVPFLYVLGGLVAFPVTVLIAFTAMVFEPWRALAYAGVGSLASAAVTYYVGAFASRNLLRDIMGRRLNRISRALASKGVLSIVAVRLVPIAPFTLVNLVAGVSHIRFADYLVGTMLGMAPGILLISALGHSVAQVLSDPSPTQIALLALVVCLWIAVSAGLQVFVTRMRSASGA